MNDRQKQIASVATDLFLTEGVGVSTAQIAKTAEVSNGTLFNAFPTKQTLIDAIYHDAKAEMFGAIPHAGDTPFSQAHFRENWTAYLAWARANPGKRRIMHFLLDSGLASQTTKDAVNQIAAPHAMWLEKALAAGQIAGPSTGFIGSLIFFFADHVIDDNLSSQEADMAFDMLSNAIGLTQ
jgi:AcrR family transcriptional regulator